MGFRGGKKLEGLEKYKIKSIRMKGTGPKFKISLQVSTRRFFYFGGDRKRQEKKEKRGGGEDPLNCSNRATRFLNFHIIAWSFALADEHCDFEHSQPALHRIANMKTDVMIDFAILSIQKLL